MTTLRGHIDKFLFRERAVVVHGWVLPDEGTIDALELRLDRGEAVRFEPGWVASPDVARQFGERADRCRFTSEVPISAAAKGACWGELWAILPDGEALRIGSPALFPPPLDLRVGIGITTFNRRERLQQCLSGVAQRTTGAHRLLVADDGSSDGTLELLRELQIPFVAGRNMGVAWNKNRLLYALLNKMSCDVVILVEDDTTPSRDGWNLPWIAAARRWGHANLAGDWFKSAFLSGTGSVFNPYLSHAISGQVVCFSLEAIAGVGYMDTRFRGYGHGHVDHSERMVRGGFGGEMRGLPCYFLIEGGVSVHAEESYKDDVAIKANSNVRDASRDEFFYRAAFRNEEEYNQLRAEVDAVSW